MKEKSDVFTEIIKECLLMDSAAFATYNRFALESGDPSISEKWKHLAQEEKKHMAFWNNVIELWRQGSLPDIFENPISVRDKLKKIREKLIDIIANFKGYAIQHEALSLAFLLESYMLDPAFMMMFHNFKFVDENVENTYKYHISEFIDLARTNQDSEITSIQIEFFCETLSNLYTLNSRLLKEKSTDVLTGLLNRGGFFNSIEPLLSLASRKNLNVGIIMSDIDNFKSVNDTYGHPTGDEALKAVGSIMGSSIRKSDISGRYGGEEFIIFAEVKNAAALEVLCEKIRKNIDDRSEKHCGVHFTISLGAALDKIGKPEKQSLSKLINDADNNLLRAKKEGKNRWVI